MIHRAYSTLRVGALALLLSLTAACASLPPGHQPDPRDPYEAFNRSVYQFNVEVDEAVLKPVATVWRDVVPEPLRRAFGNFFANIGDLVSTVHHTVQGNFSDAGTSLARFGLNSTLGVLGLGDPATEAGLIRKEQDFGLTFGRYGAEPGPYLMLPLLGPSSVRDGLGQVLDFSLDPFSEVTVLDQGAQNGLRVTRVVDGRANLLELGDAVEGMSFDQYLTIRNAYLSRRAQQVAETRGEEVPPPPLLDDFE